MKIEIGSYEAKTKLPELLRQVKSRLYYHQSRGTHSGSRVKRGCAAKDKVVSAEKLKAFMLADPVPDLDIKKLIEEGRA